MNGGNATLRMLSLAAVLLAATVIGRAQVPRTYVATSGNDNNTCTVALPCRTFQGAHDKTSAEGEVVALDTGTFGKTLIITKAITIAAASGVNAGLTTGIGQTAITISASSGGGVLENVSGVVVLRNLYLDGHGSAARGIDFQSGAELHVEGCVVSNFAADGIYLGAGRAFISDTTARRNYHGIVVATGGFNNQRDSVSIDHCRAEGNRWHGFCISLSKATIRDSVASGNWNGFYCSEGVMNITGSMATNNQAGVWVEAISSTTATVRIADSTVTGNVKGLYNNGIFTDLFSLGNNLVHGNGLDVFGITVISGT